jgi:enoyl-CoA hydratase/carnithine racemase
MAYEFVQVERAGRITVVTINRPEVMNALHIPAHAEFDAVFNDFAADPDQWVAIVTGAGDRAFSAGNDLKYTAAGGAGGDVKMPASGFAGLTDRYDLTKPVIAAVNGVAMGGGFEIALACDIIIASESAVFSLPEPRVGLAALAGGLHRLPRTIGEKRALSMILTARRVSAEEGKALGFVSAVTKPEELMATAHKMAEEICTLSPMAVRAAKEAVYRGLNEDSVAAAIKNQWEYPAMKALWTSDDVKEGPRAFAEKRAPQWKGR